MTNQPNQLDEEMRRRLYHAEVAPPDFVWPRVEEALRKKKRRFLIFFLFAGSIGLALGGLYVYHSYETITRVLPVKNAEPSEKDIASPPSSSVLAVTTEGNVSTTPEPSTFAGENRDMKVEKKEVKIKSTTSLELSEVAPLETTAYPENSILQNREEGIRETTQSTQTTQAALVSADLPTLNDVIEPVAFLPKKLMPPTGNFPVRKFGKAHKTSKACYDFAKHPTVWFFDAFAGPSFAVKTLMTNSSDINRDYLKIRKSTERTDWAFNSGIRGTLLFDQHFMVRAGLQYEQMTETYEQAQPNSIDLVIEQHYNAAGVLTIDTLGVRYGEKYQKVYNRFGMLDIPVQVGVEVRSGRSGFSFNAGLTFNVLFWKRGAMITTGGVARYFTPGSPNAVEVFQTRTGLSATGSIQWFYHLQPKLRVFAEPYFRQILQPVNIPGYPIEQRYGIGGIRLGLTKILD